MVAYVLTVVQERLMSNSHKEKVAIPKDYKMVCKVCGPIVAVPKMFGVMLCPICNIILASDIPSEKAGI
jgi:rubrerythrin